MAFGEFNQTLTGEIPGAPTNVGGVMQPGTPTALEVKASVQPSSSNDLQMLPEGRRVYKSFTLYSRQEIKEQYRLTIYGDLYECVHAEPWKNGIIPHFKAVFQKVEE